MIKSVNITNYQSHKDTELQFHKGLNVIIGTTDSGKTAIMRALRWSIYNKPGGDAFRRYGTKNVSVKIETDKCSVTRSKGDKNLYKLNYKEYDNYGATEFTAFGANVPPTIEKALNISEINLQSQFDSHFLLNDTPGNVAKFFNKIANFEKIDTSLAFVNTKIHSINSKLNHNQEDLKEKKQQLKKYKGLDKLEKKVTEIETLETAIDRAKWEIVTLEALVSQFNCVYNEIKELETLLALKPKVDELVALDESYSDLRTKYNETNFIIKSIDVNAVFIKKLSKLTKLKKTVVSLLTNIKDKAILNTNHTTLNSLLQNIQQTKKSGLKQHENALKLKTQFHKEMGNQCVLCGTKLK